MNDHRFTAHVGPDPLAGQVSLLIHRAIPGGIHGPFTTPENVQGLTTEALEHRLAAQGFRVVGGWRIRQGYDGMHLDADLERAA